jgi:hypothetical protein
MSAGDEHQLIQESLFGGETRHATQKPRSDHQEKVRVLITVKAAPNPSEHYGETVCVAGIRFDDAGNREWVRLYPINFRHLESDDLRFKKYDVVTVDCVPAVNDQRRESWKPLLETLKTETHLPAGSVRRREWVGPMAVDTMCGLYQDAKADHNARSLGLIRPADVSDFKITEHPGWDKHEQAKIDSYVSQMDLFNDAAKTPLEAPKYIGKYHWRCQAQTCNGHESMNLDWEFVAYQRRFRNHGGQETKDALKAKFLDELCGPDRDTAFYVGNQAKRAHTFSVLGVYWPKMIT